MNPFFFGDSTQALFGVYHPPQSRTARPLDVLLCPSIGQEYIRSHRALRQLATQLARAGHHVLRFDYLGQGDSAGDAVDARLASWLDNVGAAAAELRDMGGSGELALVGLRLGAAVAAMASAGLPTQELVLWDPVVRGARYLEELYTAYQVGPTAMAAAKRGDTIGAGGFPLTRALRDDLAGIDLLAGGPPQAQRALVISSRPDADAEALTARLAASGTPCQYREVAVAGTWEDADRAGAILMPREILRTIVAHLGAQEAR